MKKERFEYPLELIKTSVFVVKFLKNKKTPNIRHHEPIRSLLLYCLQNINGKWLPLNRDYKPIGLHGYDVWADYEKYDFLLIPEEKIDFSYLKKEINVLDKNQCIFLFNDCTYPDNKKNIEKYVSLIQGAFFNGNEICNFSN